ncbi:hypothetical protein A9K55_008796 [Cordyceps militaris]|uniref:Uncharacterized protein n=1 Tax=Cordyceps militaris TaxID=73501 RepID=A0A2H4SIM0_CORMI|nr:hypothetical protein A9K55_008796 [Cordyceps militaris]
MLAVTGAGALGVAYYTTSSTPPPRHTSDAALHKRPGSKARNSRDVELFRDAIGTTAAGEPSQDRKTEMKRAPPG